MTLGVCMIVRNEEENIKDALECAFKFADEVIVVDTGSTDNTPKIAKEIGAKVYHFKWNDDFSAARNESIKHATADYLMWMDADDRVDDENARRLKELKKHLSPTKDESFYVLVQDGEDLKAHFWFSLRIFPNRSGVMFEGRVHEQIIFSLEKLGVKQKFLGIRVLHTGYKDQSALMRKCYRNLRLLLKDDEEHSESFWIKYYIGITLKLLGRIHEGIEYLEKAQKLTPEKSEYWQRHIIMTLAKFLNDIREHRRAREVLEKFSHTNDGYIHLLLAETYEGLGEYEKALDEIEKVRKYGMTVFAIPVGVKFTAMKALAIEGKCFYELGRWGEATEKLEKVVKGIGEREDYEIMSILGECLIRIGRAEEGYKYLVKVCDKIGETPNILINMAVAKDKAGDLKTAEIFLRRALKLDEGNREAKANLGHILMRKGELSGAKDVFESLIENLEVQGDAPDYLESVLIALGNIYSSEGKLENCAVTLETISHILPFRSGAIDSLPEFVDAWCDLAEKKIEQGQIYLGLISLQTAANLLRVCKEDDIEEVISRLKGLTEKIKGKVESIFSVAIQ